MLARSSAISALSPGLNSMGRPSTMSRGNQNLLNLYRALFYRKIGEYATDGAMAHKNAGRL
jgi:hypothetical protein